MPETPARETVIVVHGTFSGKKENGEHGWYAPGEPFCCDLDNELKSRGSAARCWSHLDGTADYFHWDGRNDWLSRSRAAADLRKMLMRLHAEGWLVHLVGHSHGGNVIIEAVTDDEGRVASWFEGRIALLGTPIYLDSPAYTRRRKKVLNLWMLVSAITWPALLVLAASGVDLLASFHSDNPTVLGVSMLAVAVLLFSTIALVKRTAFYLLTKNAPFWMLERKLSFSAGPFSPTNNRMRRSPAFLMINSRYDEAFKSLSPLREADNPLLGKLETPWTLEGAFRRFREKLATIAASGRSSLQAKMKRTLEVRHTGVLVVTGVLLILTALLWQQVLSAIGGTPETATVWSLAFWLLIASSAAVAAVLDRVIFFPGIVLTQFPAAIWQALKGFLLLVFDQPIKAGVWGFLKSIALGLNGAPRQVGDIQVGRWFDALHVEDCVYLELPEDIVDGVTDDQKPRLSEIQAILYGDKSNWDPNHLLKKLENQAFPLIHTVYYRDPECRARIADWLADPVKKYLDDRLEHEVRRPVGRGDEEYQAWIGETVKAPNAYQGHVKDLKRKHAPPGSRWGSVATTTSAKNHRKDSLKYRSPPGIDRKPEDF